MHADECPGWISRNLCGGQAVAIFGDFVCIISGGVLMLIDLAICATTAGERELELGATLSLDASDSTRDGWAAERRRHHSWGSRAKRGHADGTLWALGACRGLTVVCVGCGSLVHWLAARARARKAGRDAFAPGDGCSGRTCSLNHRPAQHLRSQLAMAAGLASGSRWLIEWPEGRSAREVRVLARARALDTARTARARTERARPLRVRGGGPMPDLQPERDRAHIRASCPPIMASCLVMA